MTFFNIQKNRALVLGLLVGAFVLWWYSQPYPWLGAAAGLTAGLLTFGILRTGRIERFRRVFFVAGGALATIALLAYIAYMGMPVFKQMVASWNPGYYFPGAGGAGAMPFPTPVVLPAIFWRGAAFVANLGVWQTSVPTSLAGFFLFMIPVMLIAAVFGRGLCGWLCPLGGLPELTAAAGKELYVPGFIKEKRTSDGGVAFTTLKPWVHKVKYGFLAVVFLASLAAGFAIVNIFYPVLWLKSTAAFWGVAGLLTVFGVALPLVTKRRWWCYVCPVGGALASLERISLFRLRINQDKCVRCMDCARACRYYALTPQSVEHGKCDGGSCVRCGRCVEACSEGAIDITLLGSKRVAREAFVAIIIGISFTFYSWFAVQSVYLLSRVSTFQWWN
jgi:ferredoxin-type protein NapH